MPIWLIEKYKSIPLPEAMKGCYATASTDGEFWRWFKADQFDRFFVPVPGVAQGSPRGKCTCPYDGCDPCEDCREHEGAAVTSNHQRQEDK